MSRSQLEMAKKLLEAGRYQEARALLKTINHPIAARWLTKLDQIAPPPPPAKVSKLWFVLIGAMVVLFLGTVIVLASSISRSRAVQNGPLSTGEVAVAPTTTLAPTHTRAPTATETTIPPTNPPQTTATFEGTTEQPVIFEPTSLNPQNDNSVPEGKWALEIQNSPQTNLQTIVLSLVSDTQVRGPQNNAYPVLFLRCQNSHLDVYLAVGMQVTTADKKVGASLSMDDEAPQDVTLNKPGSADALFFDDASRWMNVLMAHDRMSFSFTPLGGGLTTAQFNIRGLEEAISPLRAACPTS